MVAVLHGSYGRGQIPTPQVLLWRKRIMQCLNLPTQARVFPHRPNVVIVQRPFTVGRGFLNIAQVVRTLQVRNPKP